MLALRELILARDEDMTETTKYGMPCFCFGKKIICYLWIDKDINEPYILFVDGKLLNDPELETGKRARMKIFKVNPNTDFPITTIQRILDQALSLHRNGVT